MLSIFYSDVTSYRSALYSFRLKMINSIASLLRNHLPVSLARRNLYWHSYHRCSWADDSKEPPLNHTDDRLNIILRFSDITRRCFDRLGSLDDLVYTNGIAPNSFHSLQSQSYPDAPARARTSSGWIIEQPYIQLSEDTKERAVLSQSQLDNCIRARDLAYVMMRFQQSSDIVHA